MKKRIDIDVFKRLFYEQNLSAKEISKVLGISPSTVYVFRYNNKLPKRGFGTHFMLGKHHTKASREKISKSKIGTQSLEKHPNWKGGKYIHSGYVLIRVENHPSAQADGYIREHRFVMEKHIGRFLEKTEHVHHINGNKSDNRVENLVLFGSNSEHRKLHSPKGSLFGVHSSKTE